MLKKMVKQEGFKDCGPSCLLMIIKHYKGYYDIEELKEMCKTSKLGTTAYHLMEAGKKCGFETSATKYNLEDMQDVILPCIAHVTIDKSYNHYVVINKMDFKNKKLLVSDPMGKVKYYKFSEFNEIFNHIILSFLPIKKIAYCNKNSIIKFLLNITKTSYKQLLQILIMSLFVTIFSVITTFYIETIIDNLYSKEKIIFIFIVFCIIYLLKIITDYFRNKMLIVINSKIDFNLTYDSFKQIIKLPYRYYRNNTTGEIISKINDLDIIRKVLSEIVVSIIDFPLALICLIIMYFISSKLFVISLIILFLYLLCVLLFRTTFSKYIDKYINDKSIVSSYMVESINGFESVKGCNIENKIINNFEKRYLNLLNNLYRFDNCLNNQYLIKELIGNFGFVIVIAVGANLCLNNEITIGQLLSFNALLSYFLTPIRNIMNLDSNLKQMKISINKILKLFFERKDTSIVDRSMKGDIEFKNLSYSFNDDIDILKNINLKIKQGSKIMVIGKSGSGKSTLFKMLKKYYDVPRDKVYVNDIDINDYFKSDVIYISQDEMLFTDTLLNNIDSNDIQDVSKICLLNDIVNKNNLGYNMIIEENGFNLSGGEKQRIILARAISKPFEILIIDEGLNQVDTKMERNIINNLIKKYKEKTIIYISHRLENQDLFDKLIKIENGELID